MLALASIGNGLTWPTRPIIVPDWAWAQTRFVVVVHHVWAF